MANVRIAFEILELNETIPIGDIADDIDSKLDFTRKARLVVGAHMTYTPKKLNYWSEVPSDSDCICLFIAMLNELDIQMTV